MAACEPQTAMIPIAQTVEPAMTAGTDQLIIAFDPAAQGTVEDRVAALAQAVGTPLRLLRDRGDSSIVVKMTQRLPYAAAQQLAGRIAQQPGVRWAEPDRIMQVPRPPAFNRQEL
jgi:hypothetical protein